MDTYEFDTPWSPKYLDEKVRRGLWFGEWLVKAYPGDTIVAQTVSALFSGKKSDIVFGDAILATDNPSIVLFDVVGGSVGNHLISVTITTSSGYTKIVEQVLTVQKR